jgi:uncharacterized protein GlcG (DUF336 family)
MATKAMTLRIPEERAAELEAVARAEGKSVNQTILDAVDQLIAERRKDKAFLTRVRQSIERDREVLERLSR